MKNFTIQILLIFIILALWSINSTIKSESYLVRDYLSEIQRNTIK